MKRFVCGQTWEEVCQEVCEEASEEAAGQGSLVKKVGECSSPVFHIVAECGEVRQFGHSS